MNKLKKIINNSLIILPTPINISYWWNFGSLLGIFIIIQIIRGLIISIHYCPNTLIAFKSIIHIIQNVNNGWLIHNIHINGATFFFLFLYIHLRRGIYYSSFNISQVWLVGTSIFLISIITAFLGYVLPWGQISFWGATVITNLISSIPYIGNNLVMWIWGGFSINNATLNRFFSLHFLTPFIIFSLIITHLYFLHITGSKNPLGLNRNYNKISFHLYFTYKDLIGFITISFLFISINLLYPYIFRDPENFTPANPLITPLHIQPEWYFLFAYAILRSIPNKLGGVIALIISILIIYIFPLINLKINSFFNLYIKILFWIIINNFIILTWLGAQAIEYPFLTLRKYSRIIYFIFFFILIPLNSLW
jgi:ubiquinol-cytochrome c reductase cytochrome b subunit